MTVGIILPTFEEESAVGEVIERIKKAGPKYRIYVVDSGSKDATVEVAKKKGAKTIEIPERGKGIAIKKAFRIIEDDKVVQLDADGSYPPEEIPTLLKKLENCDVVLGSRFEGKIEKESMNVINYLGNKGLTLLANILFGKKISDVCSGFWAFKKNVYKQMNIDAKHFSLEANFYVECVNKGLKLCEVPIIYVKRKGESKLTPFHGIKIAAYMINKRFRP